jgi:hypothetical protein
MTQVGHEPLPVLRRQRTVIRSFARATPGLGQSGHFHSLGGAPDATLNKTLLPANRRARRSPLPPRPVEPRNLTTVIEGEIFRKPMP